MSLRKRGWVMAVTPPLAACEYVTGGLDDQGRHPGQQAGGLPLAGSMPRPALSAQALRLDECRGAGDPIAGFAHVLAPLRCGVFSLCPLLPECERGPLALVRGRSWPASRPVCASLWLPIHRRGFPSDWGSRLLR